MANSNQTYTPKKQSYDALKTLYFVVIGLSVIKSIETLTQNISSAVTWFLFISFLTTIVRFSQGVARVFKETRGYPVIDFYMFFLHGMAFYAMAMNLSEISNFIFAFVVMLGIDSVWLLIIGKKESWLFNKAESQWLLSNIILLFILCILYLMCYKFDNDNAALLFAFITAIISVYAARKDWTINRNYYLMSEKKEDRKNLFFFWKKLLIS